MDTRFYFEDQVILHDWIKLLVPKMINSGIENDYEIGDQIGTGTETKIYKAKSKID